MRTLFCSAPGTMVVEERPDPELQSPTDAVVRVESVGICGSDGGRFHGTNALMKGKPHIGGHEYSGVVVALGSEAADRFPYLKVGTRVAGMPIDHCGTCDVCRDGIPQHCASRRVCGAHPTWPGAFAQLVGTPAKLLVPIPDGVSFDRAATVEPAACSTWSGDRCEQFAGGSLKGKTGFIAGAGPIGFLALQDVLARGAAKVVVSDTDAQRLKAIEHAGGIPVDARAADEEVPRLLGGLADFSLDCFGSAGTRNQCAFLTRPYQPSAWVGLHEDTESNVAAGRYVRGGAVCVGVFAFTPSAFKLALDRLAAGTMGFRDEDVVVTGFDEGQHWFERLFDSREPGKPQKVIFHPGA